MNSFLLAMDVVFPIFFTMGLGYWIKYKGMIQETTAKQLNQIVFRVGLPLLVFYNIYQSDVEEVWDIHLVLVAIGIVFGMIIVSALVVCLLEKDSKKKSVLIQCGYRSNLVLFGIPISVSLFGEENLGVATLLIAVIIPVYNVLAVILLEYYRGGKMGGFKIFSAIFQNPLVLGSLAGIAFSLLKIPLPNFLLQGISDVVKMTSPLAFIALGSGLVVSSIGAYRKQLFLGVTLRLVCIPVIFMGLAIFMGYRGKELIAILSMTAAPVSVSSYTMAETMDADGVLASLLVVFTAIGSLLTLFLWIVVLKEFGFI